VGSWTAKWKIHHIRYTNAGEEITINYGFGRGFDTGKNIIGDIVAEGRPIMGAERADVTHPVSEGNSDSHASATPANKKRVIRKTFTHEEAALLFEDLPHNIYFFRIYHQETCLRKLYLRYQPFKRGLLRSIRFGKVLIEAFQIVSGHGDLARAKRFALAYLSYR
jgi:hypothetical protein